MKIWVIGRNYPLKINNGQGAFELTQAKMLAAHGYDVCYLAASFHFRKKIRKWGLCSWTEDGVRICTVSVPYFPARMRMDLPKFRFLVWKKLLAAAESVSGFPDVIHIHFPAMITSFPAVRLYQKRGAAVAVTEHWTKVLQKALNRHEKQQLTRYAGAADAFICVGEPLREAVRELTGRRDIEVIPNVSAPCFAPVKRKQHEKFTFIALGRMTPVKQFDRIIEALAEVVRDPAYARVRLILAGDGKELPKLKKLAVRLHVANKVKFTGLLTSEQAARALQNSDALICFSRLETFGVPVIEAWSCGKPVIASDALGFLEYWEDALGEIVSHDDTGALAAAMKRMADTAGQYSAEYIASFAREHFSEDAVIKQLDRVYARINSSAEV